MNQQSDPDKKDLGKLTLDELIGGHPNLPAGFQILPRLLTLLDDPEADTNDLGEVIRIDANLTTAVLRVSNSAKFATAAPADNINQAIVHLGFREVYCILLEIVTGSCLKGPAGFIFGTVDLWRQSLATAVASQVLAERLTKQDPEVIFSAGLLHDFGKTILARVALKKYDKLLAYCAAHDRSVRFAEWELFGIDHAEAGGALLRSWKFPERIAAVVAGHHRPETVVKEHQTAAALISIGNVIAYKLGLGNGCPPYVARPDPDALKLLGLTPNKLTDHNEEILARVQREQERL